MAFCDHKSIKSNRCVSPVKHIFIIKIIENVDTFFERNGHSLYLCFGLALVLPHEACLISVSVADYFSFFINCSTSNVNVHISPGKTKLNTNLQRLRTVKSLLIARIHFSLKPFYKYPSEPIHTTINSEWRKRCSVAALLTRCELKWNHFTKRTNYKSYGMKYGHFLIFPQNIYLFCSLF